MMVSSNGSLDILIRDMEVGAVDGNNTLEEYEGDHVLIVEVCL